MRTGYPTLIITIPNTLFILITIFENYENPFLHQCVLSFSSPFLLAMTLHAFDL